MGGLRWSEEDSARRAFIPGRSAPCTVNAQFQSLALTAPNRRHTPTLTLTSPPPLLHPALGQHYSRPRHDQPALISHHVGHHGHGQLRHLNPIPHCSLSLPRSRMPPFILTPDPRAHYSYLVGPKKRTQVHNTSPLLPLPRDIIFRHPSLQPSGSSQGRGCCCPGGKEARKERRRRHRHRRRPSDRRCSSARVLQRE